jgi:hypothetical protein
MQRTTVTQGDKGFWGPWSPVVLALRIHVHVSIRYSNKHFSLLSLSHAEASVGKRVGVQARAWL